MSAPEPSKSEPMLVACLCAEWCGVCRAYRPVMKRVLEGIDAGALKAVWIDIEDHDEVMGDLEVQSFPTLLIARGTEALFYGTVTPHAQTLEGLVRQALVGGLPRLLPNEALQTLAGRAQAFQQAQG